MTYQLSSSTTTSAYLPRSSVVIRRSTPARTSGIICEKITGVQHRALDIDQTHCRHLHDLFHIFCSDYSRVLIYVTAVAPGTEPLDHFHLLEGENERSVLRDGCLLEVVDESHCLKCWDYFSGPPPKHSVGCPTRHVLDPSANSVRDCCSCTKLLCEVNITTLSPPYSGVTTVSPTSPVCAEQFPDVWALQKGTLPLHLNILYCTGHRLVNFDKECQHTEFLIHVRIAELLLRNNDLFKFFKQRSMKTYVSNDKHDLCLVHLNEEVLSPATRKDEKIHVMAASKPINNSSPSSPFHAKSFYQFGKKSFLRIKSSLNALRIRSLHMRRAPFFGGFLRTATENTANGMSLRLTVFK